MRKLATASNFQPTRTYDVSVLKQSFEDSLRALRTDYLDCLLLHNFEPERPGLEEVVRWFEQLRQSGRVRRYGFSVEGNFRQGVAFLQRQGLLKDAVLQARISAELFVDPEAHRATTLFAHAPLRFLSDLYPGETPSQDLLSPLLALLAARARCEVVVCSMFTANHIDLNVEAARAAARSPSTDTAPLLDRIVAATQAAAS